MLDLTSPRWTTLRHAYGPAADIPDLLDHLRRLPGEESWHWQDWEAEPLASLAAALVHQSDVYPASYAALPHLVAIVQNLPPQNRIVCLNLICCVAMGAQEEGACRIPPDMEQAYFQALEIATDLILDCLRLDWRDDDYKVLLSALVAVRGHGKLAQSLLLG
jgi:hypothetical protein